MILRVWRCRATPGGAELYVSYFNRSVRPHVAAIDGFRGARIVRRAAGDAIELVVMTEWESEAAIRSFAGDDIEAAVVEPEALALLIDGDRRVAHYEIVPTAE